MWRQNLRDRVSLENETSIIFGLVLLYKANGNDCVVTNYSNPLLTRKNGRRTTHRGMIKVKECVPTFGM